MNLGFHLTQKENELDFLKKQKLFWGFPPKMFNQSRLKMKFFGFAKNLLLTDLNNFYSVNLNLRFLGQKELEMKFSTFNKKLMHVVF